MKFNKRLLLSLSLLTAPLVCAPMSDTDADGITLLQKISKTYAKIAKKAMPATVSIKTTIQQTQVPMMQDPFGFQDDFFRQFFGNSLMPQMPQQQRPIEGGGSGFIVRSDGHVVTNFHVVKDASKITVILNDGLEFEATVKGTDPETDLAVLKIDATNLPVLQFGDSDEIQVGESVIAIGNPFGLEATLTTGTISAKGRQGLGIAPREDFIQTETPINPGNSGGPLLNLDGEVIGINTAIIASGYGNGFSIPSKMAQHVIDQIIDGGVVKRGFLGITPQQIDKDLVEALSLSKQEGVLVADVVKDSPAFKAGLQQGDIIISYNGKKVKTAHKLRNDIALSTPGKEVELQVLRGGKTLDVKVALGSQSGSEIATAEMMQKIGVEVDNLSPDYMSKLGLAPDVEGVVITKVKAGSPAATAGIRPGFLIIGLTGNWNTQKKIRNTTDFQEALQEVVDKRHIVLIIQRQNIKQWFTLKIPN